MLTNAKSVITEFLPITEWMWVVLWHVSGHVTAWSRVKENISCPNRALIESSFYLPSPSLSNDIWGENYFFFSIKDMKPVLWFIFIFPVKYFPFIFSISGSRIVIIVSFIFLRTREQEKRLGILEFFLLLPRSLFEKKYKYFGFILFYTVNVVCSVGMCLLIRKSNYLKLIRGGKWCKMCKQS